MKLIHWVRGHWRSTSPLVRACIFAGSALFGLACMVVLAFTLPVNNSGETVNDLVEDVLHEQSGTGPAVTPTGTLGPVLGDERETPAPTNSPSGAPTTPGAVTTATPTASSAVTQPPDADGGTPTEPPLEESSGPAEPPVLEEPGPAEPLNDDATQRTADGLTTPPTVTP